MTEKSPIPGLAADFSKIRYAMCWEDADVVLRGLDVQPGDRCVSIGSGGENSLSLLTRDPARVIVVDVSPAQLACLELKVAAYRGLDHQGLLELVGAIQSDRRPALYARLRDRLSPICRDFWDARKNQIAGGVGATGKFERYFALFRSFVLPLIHGKSAVDGLFEPRVPRERRLYYDRSWNNRAWRLLFRLFFSRLTMGWLGRDPSFFKYVRGSVADRLLTQTRHALRDLDPTQNPYLQWIAYGRFLSALPHALRTENFDPIRSRLDRLEWRLAPAEQVLAEADERSFDRYNMSDVFEYLAPEQSDALFEEIARTGRPGGRVVYWNVLALRRRPQRLADRLYTLENLSRQLQREAKAFFYRAFYVDEFR